MGGSTPRPALASLKIESTLLTTGLFRPSMWLGTGHQAPTWPQGRKLPAQLLRAGFRVQVKNVGFAEKVPGFESRLCHPKWDLKQIFRVWGGERRRGDPVPTSHSCGEDMSSSEANISRKKALESGTPGPALGPSEPTMVGQGHPTGPETTTVKTGGSRPRVL